MTYIIQKKLRYLENCGRINETKNYIQHGSISVYTHCVNVARMSVKIAKWLPIQVNMDALVIGALLHDYFLYDWHDGEGRHLHGLTPVPPTCTEAWIVCIADKICAIEETLFNR